MKAAVLYGPRDLRITQVPDAPLPGPEHLLLKPTLVGLCGTDVEVFKQGIGPRIPGHEVVGTVVRIGAEVRHIQVGQRVVPGAGKWCGKCDRCLEGRINICDSYQLYGVHVDGGLAEYAIFPAEMCSVVPNACTDEAAAMAQPCAIALHALRRLSIEPNMSIALFGIGGIGSLILAILRAKQLEVQIIAIDVSEDRLTHARELGSSSTINARLYDPVSTIWRYTKHGVSLAIDTTGSSSSPAQALRSVRKGGKMLQIGIPAEDIRLPLDPRREIDVLTSNGHICPIDLPESLELLTNTLLASMLSPHIIPFNAVVESGLLALEEHRAPRKILVDVSV